MSSFFLFFTLFTLITLIGQLTLKVKTVPTTDLLERLTVLIPFRNEEHHLRRLIASITEQKQLPAKIIFINDHSDDQSLAVLSHYADFDYTLLNLADDEGKKKALELGFQQVNTEYILTLDADVVLPANYFEALTRITLVDAHILPVKISNAPFFGFFNLDYYYLFALNNGFHFLKKSFVASAANFLFKKEIYANYLAQDKHLNISSGDDQYFLNYLQQHKHEVVQSTDESLCVSTEIPANLPALLQQRVRWIKKSSSFQNKWALLIGVIGIFYHWGIFTLVALYPDKVVEILLTKIAFDSLVFYPYFVKTGIRLSIVKIAIFSLLYPFWMLAVGMLSLILHPKWKGRKIQV